VRSFFIFLLSFIFLQQVFAIDLSPELKKKLQAEGKWYQYIETMKQVRARGVDRPFKEAVDLRRLIANSKTTVYLNALVILVDFNDQPADSNYTPADFDTLLFSTGVHPTGSMNDYYLETSYNQVGVTGVTTIWLRMPQDYSYYVAGQRGFGNYPNNAQKLVEDAVSAADPLVDFSLYDNDNDGTVDALFVVHSGPGYEATGNTNDIHSHAWGITPQLRDGVTVSGYSMEPELFNTAGELIRMGVFGHEFGHVLGLPDLYDTDYSSRGLGRWSMMAGGSWNNGQLTPAHFDAWCRYQLGWIDPVILSSDSAAVSIAAIEDTALAFVLWTEGQINAEYFLLENRQKSGFDTYLPSSGLLIYHIDESASGNFNDWHPTVMLEQADGLFDLQNNINSGDAGDPFPGTSGKTQFDANGSPNSDS